MYAGVVIAPAEVDTAASRLAGVRIGVAGVVIAPEVDTAASRLAGAMVIVPKKYLLIEDLLS